MLEEVAKFRAARRIWAQIMRDRFGARDPKSLMLRFHTQTAGVQLTAQQPEVNLVRVALQGLAAVLGGTQSLHTNSFDEAIALPSAKAARLALRTQQVLAYETDLAKTVDPFAGSYVVESLTDDLEAEIHQLMAAVAERGGAVAAIEEGFQKSEIERSAYAVAGQIDSGERVVVGVNRFARGRGGSLPVDSGESSHRGRAGRPAGRVALPPRRRRGGRRRWTQVRAAARGTDNVLPPLKRALAAYATVGEVATPCGRCGAATSRPSTSDSTRATPGERSEAGGLDRVVVELQGLVTGVAGGDRPGVDLLELGPDRCVAGEPCLLVDAPVAEDGAALPAASGARGADSWRTARDSAASPANQT